MKALFHTDGGWAGLVLRLTLGLVMFPPVSSSAIWRYWLGFSPGSGRKSGRYHAGCQHHGASAARVFHELVRKQQGEGYEYHVLVIGIAAAWLVIGAGRWSIDREVSARIAH
jgi:putative oxidoreductase